jgi:hypothetical protein
MVRKARSAGVLFGVFMLITASSVSAQTTARSVPPDDTGRSLWRATLIGLAVGAGVGAGVGWMRSDFHKAECATLDCNHVLETGALTPIGAAAGAAIGFLLHQSRTGGASKTTRATSVILTTSYSSTHKGVFVRTEF